MGKGFTEGHKNMYHFCGWEDSILYHFHQNNL